MMAAAAAVHGCQSQSCGLHSLLPEGAPLHEAELWHHPWAPAMLSMQGLRGMFAQGDVPYLAPGEEPGLQRRQGAGRWC